MLHRNKISFKYLPIILLFTSCSFEPLYLQKNNVNISTLESHVDIKVSNNRIDQIFRNSLLEHFGSYINQQKLFFLDFNINKSVVPLAFRSDKTVTRFNVVIQCSYSLKKIENGELLTSGSLNSIASYSVVLSEYANLSAAKDAEERAVLDISKRVSRLIGVYFSNFNHQN